MKTSHRRYAAAVLLTASVPLLTGCGSDDSQTVSYTHLTLPTM